MLIPVTDLTPHGRGQLIRPEVTGSGAGLCALLCQKRNSALRNETQIADLGGFLPCTRYSDRTRGTVRGSRRLQYDVGNEHPIRPNEWHSKERYMRSVV
jgi:hypothetical protein